MNTKPRWVFCLCSLLLYGCALAAVDQSERVTFDQLIKNSGHYANASVVVPGYLVKDRIGNLLLYRNASDAKANNYANEVDVVLHGKQTQNIQVTKGCVFIRGKFVPFDSQTVGMGYLRSHNGLIDALRISQRRCE